MDKAPSNVFDPRLGRTGQHSDDEPASGCRKGRPLHVRPSDVLGPRIARTGQRENSVAHQGYGVSRNFRTGARDIARGELDAPPWKQR
jgi:hypothetical protein